MAGNEHVLFESQDKSISLNVPLRNDSVWLNRKQMEVIDSMRFGNESMLFGNEKDDSFKGSIGNIYQSFCGQELYPTLEEKLQTYCIS